MCEQTEISYLDGDVVWVKLGASWWPGQVTSVHNLPEDIQEDLKKKPLIAAVKFFQEDTYEFVKNYQQIYKYNCTLKDDFIKKGLDKYRTKSKDGSSYMDKFPGDVEMAEKLTGGDADIISSHKFTRQQKPDISALFGEKKLPKKKREREDRSRERRHDSSSSSDTPSRKIIHPRFLKESDHEVRIRHQPASLSSTPTNSGGSPQYSCYVCNFTSSRLNVIVLHNKTHSSGGTPTPIRTNIKPYLQPKSKSGDSSTPKRKYVKKDKGESNRARKEIKSEGGKRKYTKHIEKSNKKKKPDPELREKLLADWEDESDAEIDSDFHKSVDTSSFDNLPENSQVNFSNPEISDREETDDVDENEKILSEAEKILHETESLSTIVLSSESPVRKVKKSKLLLSDEDTPTKSDKKSRTDKDANSAIPEKEEQKPDSETDDKLSASESDKKTGSDKDDKKSRLACFDFDEDDLPAPTIPPVRKIPRVFSDKNLSLKKEIMKKFKMSQALKNDELNEVKIDTDLAANADTETNKNSQIMDETDPAIVDSDGRLEKPDVNICETELEIVDPFQVEKDQDSPFNKTSLSINSTETPRQTETPTEFSVENKNVVEAEEELVQEKTEADDKQNSADDLEKMSTDVGESQTGTKIDVVEAENIPMEVSEMSPVLVKKRRGRPKKNLSTDHKNAGDSEPTGNDNRPVEVDKTSSEIETGSNEPHEVLPATTEKLEAEEIKTVDAGLEVSQLGRQRRSSRRSSKSDILFLQADRTSNDDSQSEIDDKSLSNADKSIDAKRKGRRGRKLLGFDQKLPDAAEKPIDADEKLSESVEKPADSICEEKSLSKSEEKPRRRGKKTGRGRRPVGFNKKLLENLGESTEDDEIISESHIELIDKAANQTTIALTDESKATEPTKELSSIHEESAEPESSSITADNLESSQVLSDLVDNVTENKLVETKVTVVEDAKSEELAIEDVTVERVSSQTAEITKISLDTLPPKKSQIKKFELAQIDFFENDASVEKIVIQPGPEKKIDKVEEMEIEITRIDPSKQVVGAYSEKIPLVQEGVDMKNDGKTTTDLLAEIEKELNSDNLSIKQKLDNHPDVTIERDTSTDRNKESVSQPDHNEKASKLEEAKQKVDSNELEIELVTKGVSKTVTDTPIKRSSMQTRYKGKFTPETGAKSKKEKDGSGEEIAVNTFQEAFLKTLQIDNLKRDKKMIIDEIEITVGRGKKGKKPIDKKIDSDIDNVNIVPVSETFVQETNTDLINSKEVEKVEDILDTAGMSNVSVVTDFQGVEVVVEENIESEIKVDEQSIRDTNQPLLESESIVEAAASPSDPTKIEDISKALNLDISKSDESSRASMSTPSPTSASGTPVKRREKPRIIESVSLKEPMHILKSKLLEKLPQRGNKHKLETDSPKRGDSKHSPRAKIMKMDNLPSNSKVRQTLKTTTPQLSLTKKLEALKAEEAAAANLESQSEPVIAQTPQSVAAAPVTQKLIQQSSQSLADMELDINSMPFVLSEDVLTPESIEQMPVVITSLVPPSSSIVTSSISLTPTSPMVSSSQGHFKTTSESSTETTPSKKKSGMPAILKNKGKGKPTITSVKTIVPPLTGGVKGLKFQNAQGGKASPLITQKGQPGKYVIVQTTGGQQIRYSVQGKPGTQQKITMPAGKSAGSAQIVHQGGKVVILTSPQSGQTKMIPLNTSKTLGTKLQRIMTSKGQIFAPISTQGVITSKTIIAPKTDAGSPTTSKISSQGQKIISTQGLLSTKGGVLTPLPGAISKQTLLGTFPQGILTKGGIYTPISAASLAGKTIISSKTLVTTKGTTILSPLTSQGLVTSKGTILTPIPQSLSGKTILSTQGLVGSKGTVLTPITGQQVKAIAAKSPSKGGKIQYQTVQQKMQLPALQKGQKVPLPSQMRVIGSLKSPGSTILLQNTVTGQKTFLTGKKMIKQALAQQQPQPLPALTVQSGSQQGSPTVLSQAQQVKGKVLSSSPQSVQKVVIPRTPGRQQKSQQKIVVQKLQDSSLQGSTSKLGTNISNASKTLQQSRQISGSSSPATKASTKSYAGVKSGQQKRNLLNAALNSISSPTPAAAVTKPLTLPNIEQTDPEKKPKGRVTIEEAIPPEEPKAEPATLEQVTPIAGKIEEPKVAAQPQIMALPTDSGDGTQTYVLVTIDEQGQIQPLDNNTLMSLEGTTQNPDGTRTLYIDPSSLGEAGTLDNIVLQFDNGCVSNLPSNVSEPTQTAITESFPSSEIIQTSNQDILAAALANTDFQQEIGLPDPTANVMTTGLTQTSLINQTILQSTIIPPTEPISSPAVLETSLTLNQPIMTPLEVPSNLTLTTEVPSAAPVIPSSLELPLTVTNPNIAYISAGAGQIQIPGNSMPDIGEIMDSSAAISHSETPVTTQYLVLPNLDENITIEAQTIQTDSNSVPTVSYSVSIPESMVLDTTPVQTTPSMPIIDDTYADDVPYSSALQTSLGGDQSFTDVPVSEMLVSKAPVATIETTAAQNVTVTSKMSVSLQDTAVSSEKLVTIPAVSTGSPNIQEVSVSSQDIYTSHEVPVTTEELILQQTAVTTHEQISTHEMPIQEEPNQEIIMQTDDLHSMQMQIDDHTPEVEATSMPSIETKTCTMTSESQIEIQSEHSPFHVTESSELQASTSYGIVPASKLGQLLETSTTSEKPCPISNDQAETSNEKNELVRDQVDSLPAKSTDNPESEHMDAEPSLDTETFIADKEPELSVPRDDTTSSQEHSHELMNADSEINFEEAVPETSEEIPSQSYEQFDISMANDSLEIPSQSVNKSENSPEPTQSISYESIEIDEDNASVEPPTQSFEDSKQNEATQSYETSTEIHGNAPTQSFNEIMHNQEDRNSGDDLVDDQSFPTQSYEVGKLESLSEKMETDAEMSQEGNIPSQSNDIGTDGIGTSSISTNNSGANEDETASSSYVPETPENQERDQDQESAISTSSYEIPPCEELNIASSSVIPDTSVRGEHTSIHDNGVPEIPTSSYNLNPDSSSTHVDAVPTSSYEDQVILEQNVSTSYEVPISMPGLEETSSQSFVTESSDHRNEPTSYYTHHQEVTASYYESVHQESNSRLEDDPQEEVTASYYDSTPQDIASEASQSYFAPEEATPSYSSQSITPSYYNPRPESEATQSFYSSQALDRREQSSSQNVEASQSFYPEVTENLRLRQQGEATPTYSARYPADYTLTDSPIERHDLVESSVPATRPAER
ncbi:mucin-17-like [Athalia rosae]|uniref:mucin-17-like n=1 Tax=Athalia rosae TaxID=37344 RepID=UPI002033F9B7|nr:mucin-17-like [Athalia rosae]